MSYPKVCFLIEIIIILAVNTLTFYAQDNTRVTSEELKKTGTNYFNYSDPGKINIEVNVLGGVKFPGRYLVPQGTNVIEILSLSGNVIDEETADYIRLIRSSQQNGKLSDSNIITLNYKNLFLDEKLKSVNKLNPILSHGDILVVPIHPETTFWDKFIRISSIVAPLVTLATLIISIITLTK